MSLFEVPFPSGGPAAGPLAAVFLAASPDGRLVRARMPVSRGRYQMGMRLAAARTLRWQVLKAVLAVGMVTRARARHRA